MVLPETLDTTIYFQPIPPPGLGEGQPTMADRLRGKVARYITAVT